MLLGTRWPCVMLANVAAAGVLMACGNFVAPDSTATPVGAPTQKETARAFFDRFPSREYDSLADAEEAAGFRIPQPSADFPHLHSNFDLQWLPSVSAPVSKTYYASSPDGKLGDRSGTHIWVRVAVSGLFDEDEDDGDAVMMQGAQVQLGGKDGWLTQSPDGVTRMFNYVCGNLGSETLWCTVAGASKIDRGTFDRFVESLHYSE